MIKKLGVAAWPLILISVAATAQTVGEADLRRHIEVLAADDYEGRRPGTAGGERTEAYLTDAFAKAGLKPGTKDGTWRQPVRLAERRTLGGSLQARGVTIAADDVALIGREALTRIEDAPLIFGGYGTAEELANVDIRGAVLLRLAGDAPADRKKLPSSALFGKGAAAVISIAPDIADWPKSRAAWEEGAAYVAIDGAGGVDGLISGSAAGRLLRAAGSDLAVLRKAAAATEFRSQPLDVKASIDVRSKVRLFDTANVVGKIPGTANTDEAVVLLAHWDHEGICRPEGAPDRICNGAVDNASGTAILIEVARHLAAGPRPARTIYILGATSEEIGFFGANAFADAPPVPAKSIVAALNLDTTAIGPRGLPVAIIGRGNYPKIEAVVDRTARALGRTVDTDTEANVMITRQDGWAFAQRGIPAIMATGSVSDMGRLRDYLAGVYHGPQDDLAHLKELGGAAEDATLHIALARALADPKLFPTP